MLAVIPYETFPTIELGPLTLRTFGLFVALGVLVGAWLAAGYAERFGINRDETYRVATWMVLAGIIGSRLTWAATHTDAIENPVDVIAIWEGGIQFSGGFVAALLVGLPFFRRWTRLQRWQVLDGFSFGLAIGLALGRVGCYAVGEHFGRPSNFFLATRFDGGEVREPTLGDVPLTVGTSFHNTSLYELLFLLVLFAGMGTTVLRARRRGRTVKPGTLVGVFVVYYGVARFLSDTLRVNDERVLRLTGAQWMCLVMVPAGVWILWKVRPAMAKLADAEASTTPAEPDAEPEPADADSEASTTEPESTAESSTADGESEPATEPVAADGEAESESTAEPAEATTEPVAAEDGDTDDEESETSTAESESTAEPSTADGESEPATEPLAADAEVAASASDAGSAGRAGGS